MSEAQSQPFQSKRLVAHEIASSSLFDEVPCYISIQDRNYRIVEANRNLIDEFGERILDYCYSVFKRQDERCPECPVARTFEDGRDHASAEIIFDKRGLPHHVVVNTKPLRDHRGEIVAVMELFTDITVQKELENRLHDSLKRFHTLFDQVPCFITVQDRDFRVIEANDLFKDSFSSRLGGHCFEMYKKREDHCPECPVARTFEDGRMHSSEEVVIDAEGREIHVIVYTSPIRDSAGSIVSVMEISTDITEMRRLQNKLISLGQLVAGIAHSIKNVLEGLRGGIYVGNLGFQNDNREDIRTGWEMVRRNVDRISNMVMDMLYCARERTPRRMPVSLPGIVGEAMELFKSRADESGVALEARVDGVVEDILADPKDIHSLVSNLISNAIDACCSDESEGKEHRVEVRVFQNGGHVVLETRDNGMGITRDVKEKLFRMFYSTKGAFGTGLGLLVSHKVAEEHGGTISVESTPGEGAVFTVKLPVKAGTGDCADGRSS